MAFSDISIKHLRQKYQLTQKKGRFFPNPLPKAVISQKLTDELEENAELPVGTEKAKSELIITPILKELWRHHKTEFAFFSGYALSVQDDLNGICDYILTKDTQSIDLQAPIFCLVEAKNRTIEEGYGQCAAEMYAAQLLNEKDGFDIPIMYGGVTNGFDWSFMKLENKVITIDTTPFQIIDLPSLLGALNYIVEKSG